MINDYRLKINESGQALVTLLVFIVVAMVIISGAVVVTVTNIQSSSKVALGDTSLRTTESGMEEALIRLLRDPNFGSTPQNLNMNGETVSASVVSSGVTKTVDVVCTSCAFKRKIEVIATYSDKLTITSWKEIN